MLLELYRFTPLLQFLAGAYLVMTYEPVLQKNPSKKSLLSLKENIDMFFQQHQWYVSRQVKKHEMQNIQSYFDKKWDNHKLKLIRAYIICVTFCILLMCFAGCESYNVSNKISFDFGLISSCFFIFVYLCLNFMFKSKFLSPVFSIIILLLLFHLVKDGREFELIKAEFNPVVLVLVSIWTAAAGLLFLLLLVLISKLEIYLVKRRFASLDKEIRNIFIFKYNLGKCKLSKKVLNGIAASIKNQTNIEGIFDNVISDIISKEFDAIEEFVEHSTFRKFLKN